VEKEGWGMKRHCNKHEIDSDTERWKVLVEEMSEEENPEHFTGEICPMCYMGLKEKFKLTKRELKVQSRENISLRQEVGELMSVIEAATECVKEISGLDAMALASKKYSSGAIKSPSGVVIEQGSLANILPNLIVQAVNDAKKLGKEDG